MFEITLVKREDTEKVSQYLGCTSKGITLACYENGEITGAVCFDIIQGKGHVQKVRSDDPAMKSVIGAAALNFLELHNIYDVYVNDQEEKAYYTSLGFNETDQYPQEISGDYVAYLNLEGYFKAH